MRKAAISILSIFLFSCMTNISFSQINTPPLSPEETEVVKPLERINEGWYKKDPDLFLSAYHEKAVIQMMGGTKVDKHKLLRTLSLGSTDLSHDVEKVEISGDKAIILGTTKMRGRAIPRRFDMVKEKGTWLIIGQWLR